MHIPSPDNNALDAMRGIAGRLNSAPRQAAGEAGVGSGDSERSALTAGTRSLGITITVCDLSSKAA